MFLRIFIIIIVFTAFSSGKEYVLVISLDGFRYDYTEFTETPNLDYIESIGTIAESLEPVFPSLTFPNHFSIATGCYPNKHGIIGNTFFSKKIKKLYKISDREAIEDQRFYHSEPIWNTVQKYGMKSATFFWVGSEAPIGGQYPNFFKKYDGSISYKSRIDTMSYWFNLPEKYRPNLVMLYFDEPDHTGHKYGISNRKINDAITNSDYVIGHILDSIKKLSIYDSLNVIIVSDHGMVNVSKDRVVYIDDYIGDTTEFDIISEGPYMQINFNSSQFCKRKKLVEMLDKVPNIMYYFKGKIPNNLNIKNSDSPDLVIIPNLGWLVVSYKKTSYNRFINEMIIDSVEKGMHGYHTNNKEMHGIFYAFGPSFEQQRINTIKNIDIYPMICRIFNIPDNNKIDGDFNNIVKIIK